MNGFQTRIVNLWELSEFNHVGRLYDAIGSNI